MTRTTMPMMTLALALGLTLALPAGATARSLVSGSYDNLDASISRAWTAGQLTAGEKADLRAMQADTDRLTRAAKRDGRVSRSEEDRIRSQANATVSTFRRYRDNNALRFVAAPRVHHKHVTHHKQTKKQTKKHHRSHPRVTIRIR
ncbi:MAG: hypothetical protein QGH45_04130 [Myxococcota bacterium]|nr:hypothetical protein [Myxococcota bacterium]